MNPKELRIGNFVHVKYLGETKINIGAIHQDRIYINGKEEFKDGDMVDVEVRIEIDDLQPILLTEDWLVKFGFEKNKEHNGERRKINIKYNYYIKLSYVLCKNPGVGYSFAFELLNYDYHFGVGYFIEYVHQLQNLYFSLTGKELELKAIAN